MSAERLETLHWVVYIDREALSVLLYERVGALILHKR